MEEFKLLWYPILSLVMEELNCYGTVYSRSLCSSNSVKKKFLFIFTCNEILQVQIAGGDGGGVGHGHLVAGLAIKHPPKNPKNPTKTQKTQKNTKKQKKKNNSKNPKTPKNPKKNHWAGFFF
jgi:hypothetical protein